MATRLKNMSSWDAGSVSGFNMTVIVIGLERRVNRKSRKPWKTDEVVMSG